MRKNNARLLAAVTSRSNRRSVNKCNMILLQLLRTSYGDRLICNLIHEHGGQVYLDGANMNAQVSRDP